jgi:hypothetical protein
MASTWPDGDQVHGCTTCDRLVGELRAVATGMSRHAGADVFGPADVVAAVAEMQEVDASQTVLPVETDFDPRSKSQLP